MILRWSDEAFLSLQEIHAYIARDSECYASLEIEKILSYEDKICSYPYSGRMVPEYSVETIREFIEGHYRIIYQIQSDSQIEVLTVIHTARDMAK